MNSFLLAFSMYSKIPVPKPDWSSDKMKYVMCYLPLVGVVIGALIYGFGQLAACLMLPALCRASVLLLIPILVSGGIHMDGFLDTTDALASWQGKEKKLEILKDSHTGAFAILFCGIYLVAGLGFWSAVPDSYLPVMAVSFIYSRTLSGLSVVTFKNARKDGLLATFSSNAEKVTTRVILVIELILSAAGMIALNVKAGSICVLAGLLMFVYYRIRSYKEFGGITGDLAGWFLSLAELCMTAAAVIAYYLPF